MNKKSIKFVNTGNTKDTDLLDHDEYDEEEDISKMEGYLYKITKTNKTKKMWFKLVNKDLFCKIICL
jgi:hypothetical protein